MNRYALYSVLFLNVLYLAAQTFVVPLGFTHKAMMSGLRASSTPFISGDSFRQICNFVVDEKQIPFDPSKVQLADAIFLSAEYLEYFFTVIHPKIAQPYILVTHNSDNSVPNKWVSYLDEDKLIAWFGQNCDQYHSKFFHIPIGLANRCWPHGNIAIVEQAYNNAQKSPRRFLLYLNFSDQTNRKERSRVRALFEKKPFCYAIPKGKYKLHADYLKDIASSKFVISPEGNGLDSVRTWEALWMGSIPIVKHSTLDPMFEGLPVLLVDDWDQVTQEFLEKTYAQMQQKKYCMERMFLDYWVHQIYEVQTWARQKNQEKV